MWMCVYGSIGIHLAWVLCLANTALGMDSLLSHTGLLVSFKEILRNFLLPSFSQGDWSFLFYILSLPLVNSTRLSGLLVTNKNQGTSACRGTCMWSGHDSCSLLWLKYWLPSVLFWAQTPSTFSNIHPFLWSKVGQGMKASPGICYMMERWWWG